MTTLFHLSCSQRETWDNFRRPPTQLLSFIDSQTKTQPYGYFSGVSGGKSAGFPAHTTGIVEESTKPAASKGTVCVLASSWPRELHKIITCRMLCVTPANRSTMIKR